MSQLNLLKLLAYIRHHRSDWCRDALVEMPHDELVQSIMAKFKLLSLEDRISVVEYTKCLAR